MSNASLAFVVDATCAWFDNRIEYAKSIECALFKDERPNEDEEHFVCTFYYNGDAIVDGKVANAWCEYKYNYGSVSTGDGSYCPESIYLDIFEYGMNILFEGAVYGIDFSSFSTNPTEEEVFQYSTVQTFAPLNEEQFLKIVRRAKQLEFTPVDERELEFY